MDARRRVLTLGVGAAGLFAVLIGRLFNLQVLRGGAYRDLAENNRISLQPLPAPRGRVFDRFERMLVENSPNYRLVAIPEISGPVSELVGRIRQITELSDEQIEQVLKQAKRQRAFLPLKIKSHLSWSELSRIETRIHELPGVEIQAQARRHYPHGALLAHVLGYLGEVTERDRKRFPNFRYRAGDLIGKTGIERAFETQLRGHEGVREMEVNAIGRRVRELARREPDQGRDLTLTIDLDLQRDAEAALGENSGAVVALDPRNGEVLAMASSPSYDPNRFIEGFRSDEWRELITDPFRPLSNKAVQGRYPPGSTFKIVVALAALESGKISPHEKLFCGGHLTRHDHRFHCWRRGGHGSVNLKQAMAQSCDVYFYRVAEKLGIDTIHDMADRLGFGRQSGIALGGERRGINPSREWKKANLGKIWFPGETLISAIGQGYNLATPLQLANMMAAVANGGVLYKPTLVRPARGREPQVLRHTRLRPEDLAFVKEALEEVVHGARGTAHNGRPELVRAGGKTGTSQVVRHKREASGKIIKDDDPTLRDHALYVSYAPADDPVLAIAAVVEHGGGGGSVAAPVVKQVMDGHFARRKQWWERRAL
ncbi:putative peptidoglycan glycosyltransferase [Magnetofaba australis IT-1]|uniref:Beta-lactamase n=1 Tax=Magnetofaba australis IT-1 TaxID=1434232 RepID=A0A1Y2K2G0_9PROT|nr:putative peptidoglycan glycosyltransferase [Magnetofaba australis IT-1]